LSNLLKKEAEVWLMATTAISRQLHRRNWNVHLCKFNLHFQS